MRLFYFNGVHGWSEQDEQWVAEFPNNYGVSIIRNPMSYGFSEDLYELAVLRDGSLDYTTPITDDVIGHLTWDEAWALMMEVEALNE